MKFFSSKKRVAAIGVVTAATLVGGGMAYAYWTDSGKGAGSASTGDSADYTVTFAATTGGALSPDGPVQSTSVTVANEGTGAQNLTSVQVKIANPDGTDWLPASGCRAADFSLNNEAVGTAVEVLPTAVTLAPKGTLGAQTAALDVDIQMIDDGSDQNNCKGILSVPLYAFAS